MDLRCLLLCVIFVSLCLCDRSLPVPAPTFQRATEVPLSSDADSAGREGSYGHAEEEEEARVFSEWRNKMKQQEDLMHDEHRRSLHEESQGDSVSVERLIQEVKNSPANTAQQGKDKNLTIKGHNHDTAAVGSSDKETPKAGSHDNVPTNSKTGSTDKKEPSAEPSAPYPSIKPDTETVTEDTVNNTAPVVKNPVPADMHSGPEHTAIQCDCEDPKTLVSACLRNLHTAVNGTHMFSLLITYEGDSIVTVKVRTPEFLIADQLEVLMNKGSSETIQFHWFDSEAVKNTSITVTTVHGECQIAVPIAYLRNSAQQKSPQYSPYSSFATPIVGAYVLLFIFVLASAGAWLCYKRCGRKRSGDAVKYQQLEMNASGLGTPKERAEESTDAWDESWDDDWEDTEAAKSSSRLSPNLSSRGLAARRGNKDGWDSSWED